MDTLQSLSAITCTRKDCTFKKSISLTNFVNKYARSQGLAMRTNKNASYGEEGLYFNENYMPNAKIIEYDKTYLDLFSKKDKYGAFVLDPLKNDNVGEEIFRGTLSKFIFKNVCDFDFSSLYPSIIRAFNLDQQNIIGKFFCVDADTKLKLKEKYNCGHMFKLSNKDDDEEESSDSADDIINEADSKDETNDLCPVLADVLISNNWNAIGQMFFDLPSCETMVNELLNKNKN